MLYSVRLLTRSENIIPLNDFLLHAGPVRLVSGTEEKWTKLEILDSEEMVLAELKRISLEDDAFNVSGLRDAIKGAYPTNARDWINKYLSGVRTIYEFRLTVKNLSSKSWPVLGRIQNLLKDALGGIIQADIEGYYNEKGDYILWQMYEDAGGTIPAAVLNENNEWVSFHLKLGDPEAVQRFKDGLPPKRGFLSRLFGV